MLKNLRIESLRFWQIIVLTLRFQEAELLHIVVSLGTIGLPEICFCRALIGHAEYCPLGLDKITNLSLM